MSSMDISCPECGVALADHKAKDCLARWFYGLVGWRKMEWVALPQQAPFSLATGYRKHHWIDPDGQAWFLSIVADVREAYRLLEWLWRRHPLLSVTAHALTIVQDDPMGVRMFTAPTFPLRVLMAAFWSVLQPSARPVRLQWCLWHSWYWNGETCPQCSAAARGGDDGSHR